MSPTEPLKTNLRKLWRYTRMYGAPRAYTKAAGRMRLDSPSAVRLMGMLRPRYLKRDRRVALVGCGQFTFSTIAWFLSRGWTNPFLCCYDPDRRKAETLAGYYGIPRVLEHEEDLFQTGEVTLAYIASNHATHTDYAIRFLQQGVDVYCEKPLSVSFEQFEKLKAAVESTSARFYAGYNRPFSGAILDLKDQFRELESGTSPSSSPSPFTLNCYISAEQIPPDHWYRNPDEGTRICGNVGHWLDLMIHCYAWRGKIPLEYKAQIAYSDTSEPDDNISITLVTEFRDLCTIVISSRSDPFEGINETINFQYDSIIAKIDDYHSLQVWNGDIFTQNIYRPKDQGHRRAIRRPLADRSPATGRDTGEVFASTELMLRLADMVRNRETEKNVKLTSIN